MVTAESKLDEMFSPSMLAKHAAENNTNQYSKYIPFISSIELPTNTKVKI